MLKNQSEMDFCWKNVAERMEEEVLDKYKVDESKRQAFKGRDEARAMNGDYARSNKKIQTSKKPEGRSATLRVQGLVFFFVICISKFGFNCCTISCNVSNKQIFFREPFRVNALYGS